MPMEWRRMPAELGHFTLILALVIALVQATLPLYGAAKRDAGLIALARQGAVLQFLAIAFSFGCLTYAFVVSDFSVSTVWANSHSLKPMLYKVTGVWGNHEGSLLLWVLILSLFGGAVAVLGNNLPETLRARVLAVQAMIAVGFLSFMLFTSDPFARIDPAPANGNGLNPLLQDPGLAFHPPFLYLGYVGFSIAFAFAIAALIEGRVDAAWARWVRPWTLAAWCFLTIGIAFGSYWSYYELGWGGYWAWDPTENASFMPWLAGTALLHSAIVVEKRDALKVWTILLAMLTFSLSLLGTFLVRSGAISSVHAFATDPARGVFILAFLVVVVGGSLTLFAIRAPSLKVGGLFSPISREGGLVLNNLLLAAAAATVFFGTLNPLFVKALTGEDISVGPPYFNMTFVPLMVPLVVAMGVGPLLAWKRGDLAGALSRLKAVAGLSFAAFFVTWYWSDSRSALAGLGMGLGVWLFGASVAQFADRIRLFSAPTVESFRRARRLPRAVWGMTVAHTGVAVMIIGITASGAWQQESLSVMSPGASVNLGDYTFTLAGVREVPGPNYTALQGTFDVYRDGKLVTVLTPAVRHFTVPPMDTTEAAIHTMISGDLYVVIGQAQGGGYAARIYLKPLVTWIWGGALLMALGGGLSLSDRRHRVGAPARQPAKAVTSAA
jgi:cytochrome c-type biogenesis protein CcmF